MGNMQNKVSMQADNYKYVPENILKLLILENKNIQ